jgi:excinuclease UvrABC ATPase subunit
VALYRTWLAESYARAGVFDAARSVLSKARKAADMAHADWIIDLGPGAGHDGGRVVFEGTPSDLVATHSTLTGEQLAAYVGG